VSWYRHREDEILALLQAYEKAVAAADREAHAHTRPPMVRPDGPVRPGARLSDLRDATTPSGGPRPPVHRRPRIRDYPLAEIVQLIEWLRSDTRLRLREDEIKEVKEESGFKRLTPQIRATIELAIDGADQRDR